jgi:hypothetical protein
MRRHAHVLACARRHSGREQRSRGSARVTALGWGGRPISLDDEDNFIRVTVGLPAGQAR